MKQSKDDPNNRPCREIYEIFAAQNMLTHTLVRILVNKCAMLDGLCLHANVIPTKLKIVRIIRQSECEFLRSFVKRLLPC